MLASDQDDAKPEESEATDKLKIIREFLFNTQSSDIGALKTLKLSPGLYHKILITACSYKIFRTRCIACMMKCNCNSLSA